MNPRLFPISRSVLGELPRGHTLFCLFFILAGCSDNTGGLKRYRITGTITYKNSPIPQGFVQFIPDTAQGNQGPGGGAPIVDGKYDAPRSKGVVGGHYIIRITGSDGVPTKEYGEEIATGKPLFLPVETQHEFPTEDATWDFDVKPNP